MLLQGRGKVTTKLALALRQKTVLTIDSQALANAMNDIEGQTIWKGAWEEASQVGLNKITGKGPFAAALQGEKDAHMIIVDGIEGAVVKVRDPLGGTRYTMALSEFLSYWTGVAVHKITP